jgi:hypothetical protein
MNASEMTTLHILFIYALIQRSILQLPGRRTLRIDQLASKDIQYGGNPRRNGKLSLKSLARIEWPYLYL